MKQLLLLDYFRGTDSTGLAAVRNNGEVHIAKIASDPITLFQMEKFKTALSGSQSKLFLGHNRASTSGSTNNYNAHPYQFGHITGVQNGTLEAQDKTKLEEIVGEKFAVDSQALFACIEKIGVKDTIEMIHEGEGTRGAWALAWHDAKEDTINFLRNSHRPLWFAWDEKFKRLFFASQWQTIQYAVDVLNAGLYKLEKFEKKENPGEFYRFYHLPENTHIKFNLSDIIKGSDSRPKPVAREIKGKELKKAANVKQNWNPFPQIGSKATQPSKTTTSRLGLDRQGNGIIHLFSSEDQPYSHMLTRQRFGELVQEHTEGMAGCSFCYATIKYGDPGITVYDQQDAICCAKCSGYDPDDTQTPAVKIYVGRTDFDNLRKAA